VTHIFTDPVAGMRRFRAGIAAAIVLLVIACCSFVALDYLQGPKLSSATIDGAKAVESSGQQLRMFANQRLGKVTPAQVTISPAAPFTVAADGQTLAVTFTGRLHYDTDYRVTVRDVTGQGTGSVTRSTLSHGFHTPAARVMYLDRADPTVPGDGPDRILSTGLSGSGATTVYSATRIQSFALFPQALAVVTVQDDGTDGLSFVSRDGRITESAVLPGPGTIDLLQSSPRSGFLGFTFTSAGPAADREFDRTLMTVDFAGKHIVSPVVGLDGAPLSVLGWTFLGDGSSIVAQSADQSVLVLDAAKPGTLTPLGVYQALGSSSPDGSSVVLADSLSYLRYSIGDGTETRLEPPAVGGRPSFGGDIRLLPDGRRVQQVVVHDGTAADYVSYLVLAGPGGSVSILFGSADYKGSFDGFSVSPNGQYAALTVIPDYGASVSDSYPVDARATSVTTLFIRISTGRVVRSVEGFDVSW